MYRFYVTSLLFFVPFISFLGLQQASAVNQNIVISQVQTRSLRGGTAYEELVEIYNNSDVDVDVTNWCLNYGSAGSLAVTKELACLKPAVSEPGNSTFIPARRSVLFVSKAIAGSDLYPDFGYDLTFASGLSDSDKWLMLVDANKMPVDAVEWGTSGVATIAEGGLSAPAPTSTRLIQRKIDVAGQMQDTNNNYADFELALARDDYSYGLLYDVQDLCINIDGIQSIVLDGFSRDSGANCSLSLNDECPNLPGIQEIIPDGYKYSADNNCALDLLPLKITELLPNANGVDEGNEFIEIYNPNAVDVDLAKYVFYVGLNNNGPYSFPASSTIAAGQYAAFYNIDINFTLVNTSGVVRLKSIDSVLIDESQVYSDPDDGLVWALIDDYWQYTDRPTPNSVNMSMSIDFNDELFVVSSLRACAANQYRSPETNRCRLIISSSTTTLAACRDGQYRSEETNRCRNIASDVSSLLPCAEGQERNPATNRCRSTASLVSTKLAPCKPGQERNPETNRCRNIVSMPMADYTPEQVKLVSGNNYVLFGLVTAGLLAVGYGFWEWRVEVIKLFKKLPYLNKKFHKG